MFDKSLIGMQSLNLIRYSIVGKNHVQIQNICTYMSILHTFLIKFCNKVANSLAINYKANGVNGGS